MSYGYFTWRPYVPVAQRRANALRAASKLAKKGQQVLPVEIQGREIARTFWGKAWCENLESYSDFENRLPRGRTYVRNGSVFDLQIKPAKVVAMVSGSEIYTVEVSVRPLAQPRWRSLVRECAGKVGSLIELLQGRVSESVLEILARPRKGLFPTPAEMDFSCTCPDWADMCKHVAAALYGVGARLDHNPELFFALRKVDQSDLLSSADVRRAVKSKGGSKAKRLDPSKISGVFGIELDRGRAKRNGKSRGPASAR